MDAVSPLIEAVAKLVAQARFTDPHRASALKEASQLLFWQDGMREALGKIAAGQQDQSDIAALDEALAESETAVQEIVNRLRAARDRVAKQINGYEFATLVDDICYSKVGKLGIRSSIKYIVEHSDDPNLIPLAKLVSNDIDIFNSNIRRLNEYM